jgi:acyl-CoA thioester hydrolase
MEAPNVPPAAQIRFRAYSRTRWSDEDNQGVLNNAVYLTLLEEARHQYCLELGLIGVQNQFTFVLGQTNLRHLTPGHGPADVEIQIATVHLGARSFHQVYRLGPPGGSIVWAEAEAVLVIWDRENGGSAVMPDFFRKKIADFEGF